MMDPHGYATGQQIAGIPPGSAGGAGARAIAAAALLALVLGGAGVAFRAHNGMLGRAEAVDAAWAQVESNLQRRADLVPRLVETVNRYLRHESELLTGVTRERAALETTLSELQHARSDGAQARAATPAGDEASLAALARHDTAVSQGVHAVLAVAESYPELRSADQFLELQAQLEGSENRINVARMAYNDAVRDYNAALVQLPTRWVAESQGLERRAYFRADTGARVARPLAFE